MPEPWLACKNEEGDVFFHNPETEEISWNHPLDDFYRDLFQEIKTRDLKQKKKAENEKKMRKTAGKLQGLAPLKSQLSNKQTEIEEIRIIEKVEKEKFLPNKAANKLTNISGISSNHSKKNDSFLEDEIQNREASFDLNNSSFHSIKGKNDKYSPLKDRKLRLPKDCSNKDIDKYYQIKIDELINEKEKESLEKKRDLVKKQNQLQKELEDDIPTKIADLNEKKEKLIQNFLNLEKEDEFLKEKLIKVNKEVLMKKLEELKKLQEKKKNVSRENLIGSNEKFLEDFEHEQEQVVNLKKKQIQTLKNNQNSLLESEKIKTNKILEDKKNQIEKEIKLNYQKSFEKFKNQEFNNIENLKKKELNKMSEQFEEKNQKISSESSEKYKSNYQEIYKRKFELEKKTIQHEFNELLLEFQINEERNMGIKLNKYKSHLLESELIALQNQFFEERKTLNKIYQKKLDLTKLQNKSQIKKEEHFNVRDKIFESFRRELNELVDFLVNLRAIHK